MVWDSDIQAAIMRICAHGRLTSSTTDREYLLSTVDTIERGFDPETKQPLTLTALRRWEERCTRNPAAKEDGPHAQHSDQHSDSAHHTPRVLVPS